MASIGRQVVNNVQNASISEELLRISCCKRKQFGSWNSDEDLNPIVENQFIRDFSRLYNVDYVSLTVNNSKLMQNASRDQVISYANVQGKTEKLSDLVKLLSLQGMFASGIHTGRVPVVFGRSINFMTNSESLALTKVNKT